MNGIIIFIIATSAVVFFMMAGLFILKKLPSGDDEDFDFIDDPSANKAMEILFTNLYKKIHELTGPSNFQNYLITYIQQNKEKYQNLIDLNDKNPDHLRFYIEKLYRSIINYNTDNRVFNEWIATLSIDKINEYNKTDFGEALLDYCLWIIDTYPQKAESQPEQPPPTGGRASTKKSASKKAKPKSKQKSKPKSKPRKNKMPSTK